MLWEAGGGGRVGVGTFLTEGPLARGHGFSNPWQRDYPITYRGRVGVDVLTQCSICHYNEKVENNSEKRYSMS